MPEFNPHKIILAAETAKNAEYALSWLKGDNIARADGKRQESPLGPYSPGRGLMPVIDQNGVATAVPGAKEAVRYLNAALVSLLPELMDKARKLAVTDIEQAKGIISENIE